jgi:hypothetical protein
MAKCDKQVFAGVTPGHFAQLVQQGNAAGLPISGETGKTTQQGVTVAWVYDPSSSTLTIECTDAPSFVPCSMINGKIDSVVSGILAQTEQGG